MKLSQFERDEIITALENAWKYMFQAGFVIPLVSRLQETIAYRSNSYFYGLPNTLAVRLEIEMELTAILERWCNETAFKYRNLSDKLLNKDLFWLKVLECEDPNQLEIQLSPTILELYNGVSSINVFDWHNWSDAMLKNGYDRLVREGGI